MITDKINPMTQSHAMAVLNCREPKGTAEAMGRPAATVKRRKVTASGNYRKLRLEYHTKTRTYFVKWGREVIAECRTHNDAQAVYRSAIDKMCTAAHRAKVEAKLAGYQMEKGTK